MGMRLCEMVLEAIWGALAVEQAVTSIWEPGLQQSFTNSNLTPTYLAPGQSAF
jgi:hypothetical protein